MPPAATIEDSKVVITKVLVARADVEFRVLARCPIGTGATILELRGVLVARPTRYTVQVGSDQHLEASDPADLLGSLDRHPWRFLNHSCRPNARIEGRLLLALVPIETGDEITFDYTTTEYDMQSPFPCRCKAPQCVQIVRGFRHLDETQRATRRPYLAAHLRGCSAEDGCSAEELCKRANRLA